MLSYKDWLYEKLVIIASDLGIEDYTFEVFDEQDFAKKGSLKPKCITVILKFLSDTKIFSARVQPVQMLIIGEQNSIKVANIVFSKFAETYNWYQDIDFVKKENTKMQYTNPVVLNNFNVIGVGYRSVLYISASLYILENVVDVSLLSIDGNYIEFISFNISYAMSGDSKPFPDQELATTIKSVSTLSFTLVIPSVSSDLINKVAKVMNGSISGNSTFAFVFNLGGASFSLDMKLTGATFGTAPNQTPSIQLGFTK